MQHSKVFYEKQGCPAYHSRMMLKIILCTYTQSVFSGRKMEALLKDSIRMMWLTQGYEPRYRTINRFRVDPDIQELLWLVLCDMNPKIVRIVHYVPSVQEQSFQRRELMKFIKNVQSMGSQFLDS